GDLHQALGEAIPARDEFERCAAVHARSGLYDPRNTRPPDVDAYCRDRPERLRALAAAPPAAPAAAAAAPAGEAVSVEPLQIRTSDGRRLAFTVEVPHAHDAFMRGLMGRQSLADDAGMLFDFKREQSVGFWMKDTLIPLDLLFIAADGRIVG